MQTVFWDMKAHITINFLEKDATVDSVSNCQLLGQNSLYSMSNSRKIVFPLSSEMIVWRRQILPIDDVLLLHDNARPHTSIRTRETIASFRWTTLLYPPYSPDLAPSDYHLFSPMREGLRSKYYTSCEDVKTVEINWLNEQSIDFTRLEYMFSFEGGTLLLRETVTMLRSKDVIYWGLASFWFMIHVLMLVIIPVLKKKALFFYSPSYMVLGNFY